MKENSSIEHHLKDITDKTGSFGVPCVGTGSDSNFTW